MPLNQSQGKTVTSRARAGKAEPVPDRAQGQEKAGPGGKQSASGRPRFGLVSVGVRILVALAIIGAAIYLASAMIASRPEPVERKQFERSFTVETVEAEFGTFAPQITAFGEIIAANTLNLRAPAAGDVIYVAPELRAGGEIRAGQVLVRVDPFDYELALADARTSLADARSALAEAREQLRIQQLNVDYARNSLDLAQADLDRARALFESGSITSQQLESRELLVSQRDQALRQAQSSIIVLQAGVARRTTAIESAARNVERAQRALAETTISSPYDAVIVSSNVVPGATFSQGEAVASLYQADAFEVRFTLSELQFGQLQQAGLMGAQVRVVWDIDPRPVEISGAVTRIGGRIDPTRGGVELFATLEGRPGLVLRPGAFVSVHLPGLRYEGVLNIPETALYEAGNFYVMEEGRMKSVPARVLAHDGDNLIVEAAVEPGAQIIVTRLAQAGEGVRVNLAGQETGARRSGRDETGAPETDGAGQRPQNQAQGTDGDQEASEDQAPRVNNGDQAPRGNEGTRGQERPDSGAPASPPPGGS